eukprot:TRINITY_DN6393_c0_g1_i1.p1 TRINITY_DN6393_c0_g1~~TRINITY_DN6393_c0_g1_i1.p1  ORF type:complete len:249 (+),score=27.01 TRINITY_DN6393_c0_g1_i1:24-749(+)
MHQPDLTPRQAVLLVGGVVAVVYLLIMLGSSNPVGGDPDDGHHGHSHGEGVQVYHTNCPWALEATLGSTEPICVTNKVYFDIVIGERPIGRMVISLFGQIVPRSVENFVTIANCSKGAPFCYRGDAFHRVVPGFVAQGGSCATGRSIYGATFREEKTPEHHSFLSHDRKGAVAYAEYPIGTQFYILLKGQAKYLDGNHQVIGIVTEGLDVLDTIGSTPLNGESPMQKVHIADSGEILPPKV